MIEMFLSVPVCDFTPPVGFLDQAEVIWISLTRVLPELDRSAFDPISW